MSKDVFSLISFFFSKYIIIQENKLSRRVLKCFTNKQLIIHQHQNDLFNMNFRNDEMFEKRKQFMQPLEQQFAYLHVHEIDINKYNLDYPNLMLLELQYIQQRAYY